ncbi:MAG: hypothetical protein ABW005_07700 [Burkholderiaceae bacterium]
MMLTKKKRLLSALLLLGACAGAGAAASAPNAQTESAEVQALRAECASMSTVRSNVQPQARSANEYQFVYYKGEYKGEQLAGKTLPCTETQYVAYLDKADPSRVMAAYPTAAGRAPAPGAAKK